MPLHLTRLLLFSLYSLYHYYIQFIQLYEKYVFRMKKDHLKMISKTMYLVVYHQMITEL